MKCLKRLLARRAKKRMLSAGCGWPPTSDPLRRFGSSDSEHGYNDTAADGLTKWICRLGKLARSSMLLIKIADLLPPIGL